MFRYDFCYNYVEPKYGEKANLCYGDTGSFIVYIKVDNITMTLQKMLKLDFILRMKDQLGGKIMTKFVGLRAKFYRY